jgi:diacylglycerol kinase (ATP)
MKDVLVIVNPAAARGRAGRGWPRLAASLRAAGLDFDVALTSCAGEATVLARLAVREGRALVVAAGGDGTLNEVANGFFEAGEPVPTSTRLGLLPFGTGGDFRRTFGIPARPEAAAAVLRGGHSRRIDAGRLTCTGEGGGTLVRHFVNIADAGIGGEVVARVNRGGKLGWGPLTFLLASLLTLVRWHNKPMRVVIDGTAEDWVAQQVVVANCQYYGGGMRVAPRARPDDGLLDVIVIGDVGMWENLRGLGRIRRGAHLERSNIKLHHVLAHRVEVSSPEPVLLDADGEQPGRLPATFEVQPSALELVCPG